MAFPLKQSLFEGIFARIFGIVFTVYKLLFASSTYFIYSINFSCENSQRTRHSFSYHLAILFLRE